MTLADEIQQKLATDPGLTDRELADALRGAGAPQQAVNQTCRTLASRGLITRRSRADGRIGNFPNEPGVVTVPVPPPEVETDALSEDALKGVLKAWLESDGWQVQIAWGRARGTDIVAERAGERWLIEVKGRGSRQAMRVNYFLMILGETLQRMTESSARYSIALPDLPQYRGLWSRLPSLAKDRTQISVLFVSEDGTVTAK